MKFNREVNGHFTGNRNMRDMGNWYNLHLHYGKIETQKHMVSGLGLNSWNALNV